MFTIENAQLVLKDKYGNVARIQNLGPNDIAKIHNAIADIGKLVDPVSHLPIKATATTVGVVQLADDKAIAAGTTGRVVDAKQLQDAVMGVSPANCVTNVAAGSTANKIKVTKDGGYTTTIVIDNVEHAGTATSANSVAWDNVSGKPSTFAPATHNHNSAYLGITAKAESAKSADSVAWANVSGKPSSYTPSSHTHDDRYYTESEINTKLNGKSDTTHNHNSTYLGINAKAASAATADNGVDSYGTGWIRFKNGIQICWASAEFQETVAYRKAFASEPRLICTCAEKRGEKTQGLPQLLVVNFYTKSATSFAGRVWNVKTEDWETDGNFDWIAIGSWK